MPHFDARSVICLALTLGCSASPAPENEEGGDFARSESTSAATSPCGLAQPAFCDTFDTPKATGNRSGQLDGIVWGVSRSTGNNNFGQHLLNAWGSTALESCNGTTTVWPDNDIVVCNGQVR